MDVSVIIVNYNTYALTRACVASIYAKTEGITFEVILVDNASTECDPQRFADEFPQIKLIKSTENGGFAKGNNLGIAVSTGDYVLLLNSDTELENNAITLAWQRMKADPRIGVLSSALLYPDGSFQFPASALPTVMHELLYLTRAYKFMNAGLRARQLLTFWFDHQTECEAGWVWGAFFMMPRQVLQQFPHGRLHDSFFMYVEDVQWSWYIRSLGYKAWYYPQARVIHYMGASSKKKLTPEYLLERKAAVIWPNEFATIAQFKGEAYARWVFRLRAWFMLSHKAEDKKAEGRRLRAFLKSPQPAR